MRPCSIRCPERNRRPEAGVTKALEKLDRRLKEPLVGVRSTLATAQERRRSVGELALTLRAFSRRAPLPHTTR
jgi:hypothetical protein